MKLKEKGLQDILNEENVEKVELYLYVIFITTENKEIEITAGHSETEIQIRDKNSTNRIQKETDQMNSPEKEIKDALNEGNVEKVIVQKYVTLITTKSKNVEVFSGFDETEVEITGKDAAE